MVRVLTDGVGSFKTKSRFFAPLVAAGARHAVFNPAVRTLARGETNLRNHRKIAIADGVLAMAGGMNITGEDIYPEPSAGAWQDLSFVVEGPIVARYDDIFRADWRHASGEGLAPAADPDCAPTASGGALLQVVPSGPDVQADALYDVTVSSVFSACERVWICTPYFVPDDGLAQALVIACRRGIDVRMLLPKPSNHPLSDIAGAGALREIQAAGGRVLFFREGMVHAKLMIVDRVGAMVGSANLDMRSLFLNHEVMQIAYSPAEIAAVEQWFESLAVRCTRGTEPVGYLREIGEGIVRVLAPQL